MLITLKEVEPGSLILLNNFNYLVTSNVNTLLGHNVTELIELTTYKKKLLSSDFVLNERFVRKRGFHAIIEATEEPGDKAEKLYSITNKEDLKEVIKFLKEYAEAPEV